MRKTNLGTTCKESTICISEKKKNKTVLRTIFNNALYKIYFKSKNLNIGKSYARNNESIKQFKMTAYKWKGFHANQVIHCLCPIRVFPFCWPVSGSHTQIYIMKIKRIFLILYQSMVKENHPVNVMQYHYYQLHINFKL